MTIDEAIKIKENHQRLHPECYYQQLKDADNLSIEALKEVREARLMGIGNRLPHSLLPGESK